MNSLKPYYPVFRFVITFGAVYLLLSLLYYAYLQVNYGHGNQPDPVTAMVSRQTNLGMQLLGYDSKIYLDSASSSIILSINDVVLYRVIEGCNAISIIVLFGAFVIAFAKAWKTTIAFLIVGILIVYSINLLRLIGLGVIFKEFPNYREFSHDIIFPAVIYGCVVLLWIYWIRKPKVV